jgi:CrcB protein
MLYAYVAVGGAIGAMLRFAMYQFFAQWKAFPLATLSVNVLGSFCLGVLYVLIDQERISQLPWQNFLGVGLLGAFTTFSTFSLETLLLIQQGDWLKAIINVGLNLICCLLAAWFAIYLFR